VNRVPQFFIKDSDIDDAKAVIKGDECHHLINVRRVKLGDIIDIRTDSGRGFKAEITSISHFEIQINLLGEIDAGHKIIDMTLYMSLLKAGNFEFVIQKSAEIGVNRIIPVYTSRTIPDIGGKGNAKGKIEEKHKRWNKIALSAAKQCLRDNIPIVEYPLDFSRAVNNSAESIKLACHPGSGLELKNFLTLKDRPESVSILIGPEGGFTAAEIDSASAHGWSIVNFGHTNLRAETAAIVIPSLIIYQWS
jgi:16S rRNA (uracil1498-N3)-methyltransferase